MNDLSKIVAASGLEGLLNHVHALIAVVESDGTLVTWNRAFEEPQPGISTSTNLEQFVGELDKDQFYESLRANEARQAIFEMNFAEHSLPCDCLILPLSDGRRLFVAERIETDPTVAGIIQRLNQQLQLFRVERDAANKLAHRRHIDVEAVIAQAHEISQMDTLTFLPNRRMILRELHDELLRAQRYHTQFAISIVDVDHFKEVNDTHGHLAGDEVLRRVGAKLKEQIRHPDLAGRYGGEEFLILLPNSNSQAAAEQAARLCRHIHDTVVNADGHDLQVTVSIGIAEYTHGIDTWESLLSRADAALYQAKAGGRNRWAVAS